MLWREQSRVIVIKAEVWSWKATMRAESLELGSAYRIVNDPLHGH